VGSYRFILSGGGTGGHIFPAIAIANELKRRYPKAEFLFVGAKDKMEMEKVPKAGFSIKGLWISGLHRKLTLKNVLFPLKLVSSLVKAGKIVNRFKPDVVIGTGGYASGPLLQRASGKHIPCLIQEQNSYAGITNKLLAKRVQKICVAYEGMEKFFPKEKIVKTGNPVREGLSALSTKKNVETHNFFELDGSKPILFVMGGSLGAAAINKLVETRLDFFKKLNVQLIWQCGKLYFDDYKKYHTETVKVFGFLDAMDKAYTAADFIVSRAGAGSISELSLVGKPVLFIPSPNVAEDHQTKNAKALVNRNAALMIREKDAEDQFEKTFSDLYDSKSLQQALSVNLKQMAMPNATNAIVNEIEKLIKKTG